MEQKSVFRTLAAINCNGHTEQKNGLTYLSWAWAWMMVKTYFPEATYTIYEAPNGCLYHTDGRTAWVKTGVTIEGIECIECLPVMDFKNRSITTDIITSVDVNKAVQRSLTKACARHGLGLYIYAGEDLPSVEKPLSEVLDLIKAAQTNEELTEIARQYPQYKSDAQFKQLGAAKRKELSNGASDINTLLEEAQATASKQTA